MYLVNKSKHSKNKKIILSMNNFNSHRTLILNSTFQPLSIASAKRSVALLLSKKINVLKESKLQIRSENEIITIPKVALLTYYVKALMQEE